MLTSTSARGEWKNWLKILPLKAAMYFIDLMDCSNASWNQQYELLVLPCGDPAQAFHTDNLPCGLHAEPSSNGTGWTRGRASLSNNF
jgi:hypothetical protein